MLEKNLENLDCVAPFVLYLCSGAGSAALFWNGSWESEIQNFDSFFLVKSVVMKNVHLMQQTFLKFAFVIRNIVHIAAFKQFFVQFYIFKGIQLSHKYAAAQHQGRLF